jgi:hypothetical protein
LSSPITDPAPIAALSNPWAAIVVPAIVIDPTEALFEFARSARSSRIDKTTRNYDVPDNRTVAGANSGSE